MRSWIHFARNIVCSNFRCLRQPYKLTYVVTRECHCRCLNCQIWRTPSQNELSLNEIERLARNSPFLSWIDFTGGEPTDRTDFPEIVETFLRFCPSLVLVHFPTNGLRPETIEQTTQLILKAFRRHRSRFSGTRLIVSVSIDGPPSVNDGLRGIKGCFEKAVETLSRLSSLPGVDAYAGLTLYPQNVSQVDETVASIARRIPRFHAGRLHLNIPHLSHHYYRNDENRNTHAVQSDTLRESSYQEAMLQALRRHREQRGKLSGPFDWLEHRYQQKVAEYFQTGQTPLPCVATLATCTLFEDGTLYPCLTWDQPLGNIRQTGYSLLPLLGSDECDKARETIAKKQCPHCWTPCEAYPMLGAGLFHCRRSQAPV